MELEIEGYRWKVNFLGTGEEYLLCLHGYGQNREWFGHFEQLLGSSYTLVLVDLAYHGTHANFEKGLLFDQNYAKKWMSDLLKLTQKPRIGILGYSIGARISLTLVSWFPEWFNEVWLIAPDGMPVSRTYRFITQTWLGKSIFHSFIKNPWIAFGMIRFGKKAKLLSDKVAGFYSSEIQNEERRQQLFDTWVAYKDAIPKYTVLKKLAHDRKLHFTFILGKQDRVIPLKRTKRFAFKTIKNLELIELDLGHNLLSDKGARLLSEYRKK